MHTPFISHRMSAATCFTALLLMPLALFGVEAFQKNPARAPKTDLTVHVDHPGNHGAESKPMVLSQQYDSSDRFQEYYIDTESVFCGDGQCKVVTVRIYWDDLGHYQRYWLAPGAHLEKAEGLPFTEDDHAKLQSILSNPNSPLKGVSLDDIQYHEAEGGVDATTHATPVIYENAAVKGAAWTSYTLWHWANGEMSDIIRRMTTEHLELNDYHRYLEFGNSRQKAFALEQLIAAGANDTTSIQAVANNIPGESRMLTKQTVQYLEAVPTAAYLEVIEAFYEASNAEQRRIILDSLRYTQHDLPKSFLDTFSQQLSQSEVYQEIDLILKIMQDRNRGSEVVTKRTLDLLNHADFLVARKAFWMLSNQTLTAKQQKRVDAFEKKFEDRL